jgi:serine phosphatase RsbU (regulator of sigma subunit)
MAALLSKLVISAMLVLAWLRAGSPVEPRALRQRLAWSFGLALALRLALELLMRAAPGAKTAAAFVSELVALALLWLLLQLALVGPMGRAGRITRLVFTAVGLLVFWAADPGTSMFLFWFGLTRCAWATALETPERFWTSIAAFVAAVVLFAGVHHTGGLSHAANAAEGIAWFVRGLALVQALFITSKAFMAFTADPTLGIRRVSRRLVLSHVLVVSVPLVIVVTLWISSTYLGVNADRVLLASRAVDREAARLEESLHVALSSGDAASGARAVAERRLAQWPALRVYAVGESTVTALAGGPLPGDSLLTGWVARLDSLPNHGVVEFARQRYLGAAARRGSEGLVALVPIRQAFDSTLSPMMGADVSMPSMGRAPNPLDSLATGFETLGDSLDRLPEHSGDSLAVLRMQKMAHQVGRPDSALRRLRRSRGGEHAEITVGSDTLRSGVGLTGLGFMHGVQRDFRSWRPKDFPVTARASFHATLAGLFVHLKENPAQIVPVLVLALLAFLLLPLANLNLTMVRGMGGSITRAIGALREGAKAYGEGRLAHRIPIAGDDDLWDTARQFNQMAEGLERARELEKERDRMEHELDLARRIQARLLPASPPRVAGLDVAGLSESAREVGGDYFDHLDLGGGRLLLVIADVSGKGVPAALLMSGFRASLMSQDLARVAPEAIAARVNDFLNQSVEPGKFVTAFIGVLDGASGRFAYVNAGHNPPVLLRAGGAVELLEAGGVILGIMPGSRYTGGEATLAPGDLVALYTDGVTEGADAANEMWGEERLSALLRSAAGTSAQAIASRIVREVRGFEGERGPADDITVLVAKRVEPVPA